MSTFDDVKMLVKDAALLAKLTYQATEANRNKANLYIAQRKVDGFKIDIKTSDGREDYFDYRNTVISILTDD